MTARRMLAAVAVLAMAWGGLLALAIQQPGYTDAYYYYNAAQRLATSDGLTDPYLWVYINAPDSLPGPSHTYWMPLQSLLAAGCMAVFGAHFGGAQVASWAAFVALTVLAAIIGLRVGGSRRHGWLAALLVMFSGFFTPFWTTTDTFAVYGVVGASALLAMGHARSTGLTRWFAVSGTCAALAHLARADGVLLVVVLAAVALWPGSLAGWRRRLWWLAAGIAAYLFIMLPWFARNIVEVGSPLPAGGLGTIWLRGYDEVVNYPPGTSAREFLEWGAANILSSRWEAFRNNLGTFVAVETWIVLGPFILVGGWLRRRDPLILGVALYALGLHAAMTLLFAYPGYRGGLFHSSPALLPYWAALGTVGLDASVAWAARMRRWPRQQAQRVFSSALIALAVLLSVGVFVARLPDWNSSGETYAHIAGELPAEAVVMVNDPPSFYYHTGRMAVVIPNAPPLVIPEIAARYGVTHLIVDANRTAPFAGLFTGDDEFPFLELLTVYSAGTDDRADDIRLYAVVSEDPAP